MPLSLGFPQKFTYPGTRGGFYYLHKKAYKSCPPECLLLRKERGCICQESKFINVAAYTAHVFEALLFCMKLISFSLAGLFAVQWTLHVDCF